MARADEMGIHLGGIASIEEQVGIDELHL